MAVITATPAVPGDPRQSIDRQRVECRGTMLRGAFAPFELDDATIARLLDAVRVHALPAGSMTLLPPDAAPAWWLLAQGDVAIGSWSRGGLIETRTVLPGQWLDVASAWSGATSIETLECRTDVVLWALPLEALVRHPSDGLAHAMCGILARQVRRLTERGSELAIKDVLARVARWLLRQTPELRGDAALITLHESKRAIAQQLAMASETLSRTLRRLVELGLIDMNGYELVLRDVHGLQAVAQPQRRSHRRRQTLPPPRLVGQRSE